MRKTLFWTYIVGGFGYLAVAGVVTWHEMDFMQWWRYMAWQMSYAPFWPLIVGFSIWR